MVKSVTDLPTQEQYQTIAEHDLDLMNALTKSTSLNFSLLKKKLITEEGWTVEGCLEVENLYRMFLALKARYPERRFVPNGPIDDFWHAHILDTRAYEQDCQYMFGGFLHHFPYLV
jgi:hypothetical protein